MRESNPRFRFVGATRYRYTNRARNSRGIFPGLAVVNVETFRLVEIKHAICVQSFHGMQSFHVVGIPGRIRTCDARFVVWNDLRFTTGTRLAGLMLRCRDSNSDQLVNSQRSCRWTTPECEVPHLAAHRALAHGEPSWRGADSNRYYPAYGTGVLPLDDRAVTLDGSDPSSPA